MEKHEILPVLEKVSADIADFSVGFATLRTCGGTQDADPAGSGALVTVGSVHGKAHADRVEGGGTGDSTQDKTATRGTVPCSDAGAFARRSALVHPSV